MKKREAPFLIFLFFGITLVLLFAGCTPLEGDFSSVREKAREKNNWVPNSGSGLAAQLASLQTNAKTNGSYNIYINADESIKPTVLSYSGRTNISVTLRSTGNEHIISLSSIGSLFTVGSGVTLTLNSNITLQGRDDNNNSLVHINSGGTLIMNIGSCITGNKSSTWGGGIYVDGNGTFNLNGGTVSTNVSSAWGGGVFVNGGTFTMNSGYISGNSTSSDGGGVYVFDGSFTMNGGIISGNTASGYGEGGGVYAVSVYTGTEIGTFYITTGTIYGSSEAASIRNNASWGAALGGYAQYGTFSGSTWNSNGYLDSAEDTIRVVNGVLQQ